MSKAGFAAGFATVNPSTGEEIEAFSYLTERYISGRPVSGRVNDGRTFLKGFLSDENLNNIRGLDAIAKGRGQTLAQMAIAWVLRDVRITSAIDRSPHS